MQTSFSLCADINCFTIMPFPAARVPRLATTATGRQVEFGILHYCLWDLFDTGYLHLQEYTLAEYWLRSYQQGGALPGCRRFFDIHSNDWVYFTQMLDGLFEMFCSARDAESLNNSSETEATHPSTDSEDILQPWPHMIGRFGLAPQFRWAQDSQAGRVLDMLMMDNQENHGTRH